MEYIVSALNEIGYDVELVSASGSAEPEFRFHGAETKIRNPRFKVHFFASFGGRNKLLRIVRNLWHSLALLCYLLFRTRRNEPVIVYHSLGYYNIILLAKRIRKFRLLLEVEEIYQDVSPVPHMLRLWEYRTFRIADGYIFSTELLNEKINVARKPCVVIYGTYRVEPQIAVRPDDGTVHVVYAGTFDIRKGGAAAAAAAEFLPGNYHVHILGFGNEKDTAQIRRIIEQTASRSTAKVTFEGLLKGTDYIRFLQKCHIGLSTQDPLAAFNATSFPSKILSYMSNGLQVVSIRIEAIEHSAIGAEIHYYTEQTPQHIAEAVVSAAESAADDNREVIKRLDEEFKRDIASLLN
ncbi:glycosyltransferase [Alistipes sp.]|uniref:glycosyltransferase n=1 Tax=unclassified Alistipes TaxID=2608932 RepID=UPI00307E5291